MLLTSDLTAAVLAAATTNATEAGAALGRTFDGTFTLEPGEANTVASAMLSGAGLVLVLTIGDQAAVVVLPELSGVLPTWYTQTDATATSKLATLAQELGMLVLPDSHMPEDSKTLAVRDLKGALARGGVSPESPAVSLKIASGELSGDAWVIWPVPQPTALADPTTAQAEKKNVAVDPLEAALPTLPKYTRSLLKIRVPIRVTLAQAQQPLSRIVELAPGSIIPFTKSCDDTLVLEVNNHPVAMGEAVKVGDKFGLRVTSMIMPEEQFVPLAGKRRA